MKQRRIPAAFMRGGTSNAIVFRQDDLPEDRALWDKIFLAAMGTPDPNGRQLNGMGGGISSLSKVCVVGAPTHPDADIDYTFAQIGVQMETVGYGANCGNMSAAMGPFAIDEGIVSGRGFIAIAAVIFGGWTLRGTIAGCLLFAIALSFRLSLQVLGYDQINSEFLQAFPFLVTLVGMAIFAKRVRPPAALARPFIRGLK